MMKILVIRRDNIGDLVCTTPLLQSLRHQLPDSRIEVLVTSYNKAVLEHSDIIDVLHYYTKGKHRHKGDDSRLSLLLERFKMIWELRQTKFDWVLLPGGYSASAARFARLVAGKRTISAANLDQEKYAHEVEQSCHLLSEMALKYETPAPRVLPDIDLVEAIRRRLGIDDARERLVGLHISARKPSQRWPYEKFVALANWLTREQNVSLLLFWSPGSSDNPLHPGDDEKAQSILSACADLPIIPVPTLGLDELIAAISICDVMVCADGGAMHLAAGLRKPIVCMFGNSSAERWHPWGVPHILLQPPTLDVADITVQQVQNAYTQLMGTLEDAGTAD